MDTTTNDSEPEWPLGWSIQRYNRTSHNELKLSVSQLVRARLLVHPAVVKHRCSEHSNPFVLFTLLTLMFRSPANNFQSQDLEHMIRIARTYPGPILNRDDGEPEWPVGWSLERFNSMNAMEVFDIPQGVSDCDCNANAITPNTSYRTWH
jgi:hypothetical protein